MRERSIVRACSRCPHVNRSKDGGEWLFNAPLSFAACAAV